MGQLNGRSHVRHQRAEGVEQRSIAITTLHRCLAVLESVVADTPYPDPVTYEAIAEKIGENPKTFNGRMHHFPDIFNGFRTIFERVNTERALFRSRRRSR